MARTSTTRLRRDASASIFAFGLAGLALLVHVVRSVTDRWSADVVALPVIDPDELPRTLLVETADLPEWALVTLRVADVLQWATSAAVIVLLSLCVLAMLRGDVFVRSTARWATAASWIVVVMLVVPGLLRRPATNLALQSRAGDWDAQAISTQWWYLYVGAMTLSFVALVLHRGSQLQKDQDGLI